MNDSRGMVTGRLGGAVLPMPGVRGAAAQLVVFLRVPGGTPEENQRVEHAVKEAVKDVRLDGRILQIVAQPVDEISTMSMDLFVKKALPFLISAAGMSGIAGGQK